LGRQFAQLLRVVRRRSPAEHALGVPQSPELGLPQRLIDAVTALGLEVDVLVNNAGVISTVPMLDADRGELADLINLNVRALTELTHHYGRRMAARGYGRILNVASVAAFQPVPGMGVYAASKAFVLSLTESLSEELRGTGVTVTALCPGPTRTEIAAALEDAGLAHVHRAQPARDGRRASARHDRAVR